MTIFTFFIFFTVNFELLLLIAIVNICETQLYRRQNKRREKMEYGFRNFQFKLPLIVIMVCV